MLYSSWIIPNKDLLVGCGLRDLDIRALLDIGVPPRPILGVDYGETMHGLACISVTDDIEILNDSEYGFWRKLGSSSDECVCISMDGSHTVWNFAKGLSGTKIYMNASIESLLRSLKIYSDYFVEFNVNAEGITSNEFNCRFIRDVHSADPTAFADNQYYWASVFLDLE